MAVDHLWLSGRKMKLLFADIDPHVIQSHVQIGIAGESQTHNIEKRRHRLIGNLHVDMLEQNDIADVFFSILAHGSPRSLRNPAGPYRHVTFSRSDSFS